ncbi:hypothetical protein Taro_027387 [Colocasia esculenta]|uniref:Electron transfer flavoprotein alpha/beta-subunit N-terminal domain-containing protein n=1 Tax=Colocasia esculenta TaxID=4460 RepID=A0A843VRF5_COLES|nr:hypothetical protein [Colocasia esculenta]
MPAARWRHLQPSKTRPPNLKMLELNLHEDQNAGFLLFSSLRLGEDSKNGISWIAKFPRSTPQEVDGKVIAVYPRLTSIDVAVYLLLTAHDIAVYLLLTAHDIAVYLLLTAHDVLVADTDKLLHPLAEIWAELVKLVHQKRGYSYIIAASSSFGKNILPRAAALLDVSPITDVIGIPEPRLFIRWKLT